MRTVGFSTVRTFLTVRGRTMTAPVRLAEALEGAARATGRLGFRLVRTPIGMPALGNRIAAIK